MTLQEKIEQDFLVAFKAREEVNVSVLRMMKSALTNKKIEKKMPKEEFLADEETMAVLKSEIKKRKDSIEAYENGGRSDLAEKEKVEIEILEKYLPEQMSEDQVRQVVKEAISAVGAGSADFGKVMGEVMKKAQGQADGGLVSRLVKEELEK